MTLIIATSAGASAHSFGIEGSGVGSFAPPEDANGGGTLPATAAAPISCDGGVGLHEFRVTPRGITFLASAPVEGRLVHAATADSFALAGYINLTVDVPGASLGTLPAVASWAEGPIASMRIARYQSGAECGLRIRLQVRTLGNWTVQTTRDGFAVFLMAPTAAEEEARLEAGAAPSNEATGSLWANGYYTAAEMGGAPSVRNSQVQVGLAERIPGVGTLRLFAATLTPHDDTSAPYGAVGLGNMRLGAVTADVAAGDLQVGVGETAAMFAAFPNLIILRGAGASGMLPSGVRLDAFGGRAAQSAFFRLPGQTAISVDISQDHVWGVQGTWASASRAFGLGLGWAYSSPQEGSPHNNLFQSLTLQATPEIGGRLLLEESAGDEAGKRLSGTAITVEPQARGKNLFLGGYLRFTSVDFRPPLGSSFYASLRHSYTLYGGFSGFKRLSFSVNSGESKSFDIFDPQAVGTLATSRGAGIGYQLLDAISVGADYSESTEKSDPGALLPADSVTTSSGISSSWSTGKLGSFLRYAREQTTNYLAPELGLDSRRGDLDLTYPLETTLLRARLEYLDSTREDGTPVGQNYSILLESRWTLQGLGSLWANVGHLVQPAGVTLLGSSQSQATLGFQLQQGVLPVQAGATVSYQRIDLAGSDRREGWTGQITVGTRLDWGVKPVPTAPAVNRALPFPLGQPGELPISRVRIIVFEDADGNGRQDPGEPGISGVRLRAEGQRAVTDERGAAEVAFEEGQHEVRLEMQGPALDYLAKATVAKVVAQAGRAAEASFALVPAGRIAGRVTLRNGNHGANHNGNHAAPLGNIRIVAKGPLITRATLTDDTGAFDFGRVPTGEYAVELDEASLPGGLVLAATGPLPASVTKGGEAQLEFAVRRATARERIIEEKPRGGR